MVRWSIGSRVLHSNGKACKKQTYEKKKSTQKALWQEKNTHTEATSSHKNVMHQPLYWTKKKSGFKTHYMYTRHLVDEHNNKERMKRKEKTQYTGEPREKRTTEAHTSKILLIFFFCCCCF